jgi:hypothetical protein
VISAYVGEGGMRNKDGGCPVENGGTKKSIKISSYEGELQSPKTGYGIDE